MDDCQIQILSEPLSPRSVTFFCGIFLFTNGSGYHESYLKLVSNSPKYVPNMSQRCLKVIRKMVQICFKDVSKLCPSFSKWCQSAVRVHAVTKWYQVGLLMFPRDSKTWWVVSVVIEDRCDRKKTGRVVSLAGRGHTWYLSRAPRAYPCKFFLGGVNFYRFNVKNWQFTVYFAVITQKIGNFLCILS